MTSPPPKLDATELIERFRRYVRDRSLPLTHQREAIASALFSSTEHLSVEELEDLDEMTRGLLHTARERAEAEDRHRPLSKDEPATPE
ncbi:MAG: hypothetical protein IIA44_15685 [Acidobacteria bacterium]|nr:hypothetical protein [Acidobacteriota bacterium]